MSGYRKYRGREISKMTSQRINQINAKERAFYGTEYTETEGT